jgi:hypothetical protein
MDKKTYGIGILSITAAVLFVANFMPIRTVKADEAIKERDFTVVTSRINQGGEALYICDNRTGQMAVFTWEAGKRQIMLRDLRPIVDLFHD